MTEYQPANVVNTMQAWSGLYPSIFMINEHETKANSSTESSKGIGEAGQIATLSVVLFICFLGISFLLFQLYSRKDVQPLKIKSPWLLIFSVAANLGIIV